MNLKSFKVRSRTSGGQVFTVIANADDFSMKELNRLFQKGMDVVVCDERSELRKGVNYDKD